MSKTQISFPWFGFITTAVCTTLLYLSSHPEHIERLSLPVDLGEQSVQLALLGSVILVWILELTLFHQKRQHIEAENKIREEQFNELLKGKSNLQNKVRKYADHTEKLKLFISDRLIEYIEYDEKFLHFKNIAAEVRHNGIISYDKVRTALQNAVDLNQANTAQSREALRSMRYLWDLLDLSTTDNMAMYIANKLYEAEEQYYQQQLQRDAGSIPYSPTYDVRQAIFYALQVFIQDSDHPLPPIDPTQQEYLFQNKQFVINLSSVSPLLGNENYIVLLMENIVNNALFHSANPKSAAMYAKIGVTLDQNGPYARLRIYNAGPHIPDDKKDDIFKLGYSTRDTKGHHGKGLGLYFVSEIVKGNEGKISFENVQNKADVYRFHIELEHGTVIDETVRAVLDKEKRLYCTTSRSDDKKREIDFESEQGIDLIEIAIESSGKTHRFTNLSDAAQHKQILVDPNDPAHPRWCLEVSLVGHLHTTTFKPLDISGVEFTVLLPTAASRLEAEFHEHDEIVELGGATGTDHFSPRID